MNIQNLVIEVTRKCNLTCEHCLRGDMENKDLDKKYIDTLLNQVDNYISEVTFTGGEPTLNVPIMEYFLEQCKSIGIGVGSFYIATNGKKISEDFVLFCLKMYSYCDNNELTQIHYSNDIYHEYENDNPELELLKGLSFFSKKWDKTYNYDDRFGNNLLNEGRGQGMGGRYVMDDGTPETQEDFNDRTIYLNCNGDIIIGCDWSFENQEHYKFCEVDELAELYDELPEY